MRLSIIIIFQFIYCVNLNAQDIFRVNVDTISSRDLLYQEIEDTLVISKKKKKNKNIFFWY